MNRSTDHQRAATLCRRAVIAAGIVGALNWAAALAAASAGHAVVATVLASVGWVAITVSTAATRKAQAHSAAAAAAELWAATQLRETPGTP
jgi:hypothetical protein